MSNAANGRDGAPSVAIVGGGFGGIGTAITLSRMGISDIKLFERGERLGGTWHHNTYPGLACDVPSHLYSFSFARNPRWGRRYSPREEIQRYLEDCAERFGIADAVHTGVDVQAATWDEDAARWHVETSAGGQEADLLVCCCGHLTVPNEPRLPGLERFGGPAFHSARWRHDVDLEGKRVGVIGTGASAIQFVPAIQPFVERVHVFQRSAPWVMPKLDRAYQRWHTTMFERLPATQLAGRLGLFAFFEASVPGFTDRPGVLRPIAALSRAMLRRQVRDPELRHKLTPSDPIGCKRILVSSDWYPTMTKPNVELVTDGIAEVTDSAVVTNDGNAREVDVLIFGTGFRTNDFVAPMVITGRDGLALSDAWDPVPQAYLGTTIAGFPNLFILYGPNTNMGVGSAPYLLESQARHVAAAAEVLRSTGARAIEVRPEAQIAHNEELRERLARSVWESGCSNWYVDDHGLDTSNWPGSMSEFRRRTSRIDLGAYELDFGARRELATA